VSEQITMTSVQETRDADSSSIVRVENLSKNFGKLKAVDGVTFEVKRGEIFGFLGPNGAGKSTTIKMLTTLLHPSSGSAEVCGYNVAKDASEVRRNVGVVPQEYTADEDMTGYQNIMLCADLYGIPRSDSKVHAQELLKLVELQEAADRKVSTYSGGMRRRLELACGLINYPKLLFMDEPTLGLDVQTRAAVWKYIRTLKEEYHMTLFLTTHYLEEADSLCDRIAIIDHGHIIRVGSPDELKASI
jgi:ABC-2 type transport system ATP-binding protein